MERQLKQRLLGAVVIVALGVIFLPIIFDGDGYRQLSGASLDVPEQPHISFEQNFPELAKHGSRMAVKREQLDLDDLPSVTGWFVRVDGRDSMDSAVSLVRRLGEGGYKASYRMATTAKGKVFMVEVSAGNDQARARDIAARIKKDYGFKTSLTQR